MRDTIKVLSPGLLTLIQDAGRRGHAHLGVPRAGAFDTRAWRLANRLVGNTEQAAALECLAGGLTWVSLRHVTMAVAGAVGSISIDGRNVSTNTPIHVSPGQQVHLGPPLIGLRYYVSFAGGIDVGPVLGSRSYDTLGRLGPPPVAAGQVLGAGSQRAGHPLVDHVPVHPPSTSFAVLPGPDGHEAALAELLGRTWELDPQSDRIGVRLAGEPLTAPATPLPSKPMVLGAVQVPPNGLPIVLGPDHPTTGGYPVIAVVTAESMCDVAQWSGGPRTFRRA
ncbi:MAG: biotin-dependent carboxyltransferase family protein [Micrococcales bacterium]|nr:biotin-dependent carboxyltransferase family protein [Micrococcales bacterium]